MKNFIENICKKKKSEESNMFNNSTLKNKFSSYEKNISNYRSKVEKDFNLNVLDQEIVDKIKEFM